MLDAFVQFWHMVLEDRIICGVHHNLPNGCFHLHHPNPMREK